MTAATDARAIEASLEIAAEHGGDLTPRVYTLLFEREPEMQAFFWRDKDDGIKGEMLMKVIEAILDFIDERRYADHLIRSEVANHESYEVPPEVFASFFVIVAEVVREACGTGWTDAMAEAWDHILVELNQYVSGSNGIAV